MASNLAAAARGKREKVTGVTVTSSKLSMDHFKSKMWNYYTKLGDTCVECKVCKKQFSFHNSTMGMREHLHTVHSSGIPQIREHSELDIPEREGAVKRLKQTLPSNSICTSISEPQTQAIANLILEMICSDLHSLSVVEEKGFARLVTFLDPNLELPTPMHLAGMLWHEYNVMKQQLKCCLQAAPSIVLSIQNWTDNSKRSYLSVTANVIDSNWRFCRYLLETHPVHQGKTEDDDDLGKHLHSVLVEFGLSSNLVSCVVHDNSPMLSSYFKSFKDTCGWACLCCTAHILQGCIKAGLEVEEMREALTAVRDLVSYFQEDFKASCFLNSKLEAMNKPRLVLDTETCWVSTLEMCQNLLDLKWAILSILEEHKVDNLSEQHWKLLQDLVPMLKTIWIATLFLQEEQNASISSLMPCLFAIFNSVGQSCEANGAIKAAANQIQAEICRHWDMLDEGKLIGNPAVIASFLDPRFKELRFLKPWARGDLHERVKNMLLEPCVTNLQWSLTCVTKGSIDTLSPPVQDGTPIGLESIYDLLLGRDPTAYLPEAHHQLENYIVEPVCKRTTHPLQWWNSNHQRYPALARLARQYLAIPATAVKPETAFGMLQDPLQIRKAALEPKHMAPILFLHQNKDFLEWNLKAE
ncbi:PREDICTED: zinc finger BED domain-containing protein 1-like [Nanorana parkeri]|uniref:zinc finger BED domain-containing protein 1-like n=1 Tax=Nanorana parkeri TaxID=125878 RepID=UPI0008542653|nr:PREDICTED: zinc finger BED domain-containing protein 1-like [Nanorana parkeri]